MESIQEHKIATYHMSSIIEEYMKDMRSTNMTKEQYQLLNQFEADIFPYLRLNQPFYKRSNPFIPSDVWRMI